MSPSNTPRAHDYDEPDPPEWQALVRKTSLWERFWDLGILWAMRARMMTSRVFRIDENRVLKWIYSPTDMARELVI
ncbi:hypothetical protein AURDEDRAFT_162659 [Auricularia subglabra TFB-10046 SS5]|nr:hypothetical protein AURDEDRAFT_162659 [Auricularia subglabra TFB-10046 SS5]